MASVQSQLTLNDGMSAVLKKITSALNTTLASFEQIQRVSGNAVDVRLIEDARGQLAEAGRAADKLADDYRRAAQEEERLNDGIRQGTSAADGMLRKVVSLVGAYTSISGVKSFATDAMSAANTQINAQVQVRTVLENMGAVENYESLADEIAKEPVKAGLELDTSGAISAYDAVLQKASEIQGNGIYGDEAMIAGAAEFATYFSDANAILSMMDTLSNYAMGMSGGGELDSKAMVDYATGIGKLMTGSYGAMTKKGFEFSDVQKAIIEGTATEAEIVSELGVEYLNMSSDMQAAAAIDAVISESWAGLYESMSNTPEGKLIQLNNTLGDIKENMGAGIYPAVVRLVDTVQSRTVQIDRAAMGVSTVLGAIINLLSVMTAGALAFGSAVADNWSWIEPILWGVASAMLAYLAVTKGVSLVQGIAATASMLFHTAVNFLSIGFGVLTGNTAAASAAVFTFNSALLASPITWVVLGTIALASAITTVVRALKLWGAASTSVIGTVCGLVAVAVSIVLNLGIGLVNSLIQTAWSFVAPFLGIIEFILNVCNGGFNTFRDGVANLIGQIISWFLNLGKVVTAIIDAIFGTDWTAGLSALQKQLISYGKNEKAITLASDIPQIDHRFNYGGAFEAGAAFGDGISDKIGSIFHYEPGTINDYADAATGLRSDLFALDDLAGDVGDIAGNTADAAKSLELSSEELKYLRDIAERDAINRFTTAEVKLDFSGMTNRIDSDMDLDGVIRKLTDDFTESLVTAAEGVHE